MTNVEQSKKQIYDLLFYDWSPDRPSQVKPEVMSIIKNSFDDRDKQSMALAELHFNIQHATSNLIDYIELCIPNVDLDYATQVAKKFVIKSLSLGTFWKQLEEMGVIPEDPLSDMV